MAAIPKSSWTISNTYLETNKKFVYVCHIYDVCLLGDQMRHKNNMKNHIYFTSYKLFTSKKPIINTVGI